MTPADDILRDAQPAAEVYRERTVVSRSQRLARSGTVGTTVWITGLPAAGKSTLAGALEQLLLHHDLPAYRLDGDNLRLGLNADLGFSHSDRSENVRRTAHAARLLADAGVIAIVALVSPYASDRALARRVHVDDGLGFLEVWMSTSLAECERRDPKELYARARRGELHGMTGIDDPYEPPAAPEITIAHSDAVADAAARVWQLLRTVVHR